MPYLFIEHPSLNELANDNNLLIYGVLVKDQEIKAKSWLAEHGNPYDIVAIDKYYQLKKKFKLFTNNRIILPQNGVLLIFVAQLTQHKLSKLLISN